MPYIKTDQRLDLELEGIPPRNEGELNYCIFLLLCHSSCDKFISRLRAITLPYFQARKLCYKELNDFMGALTCSGLEFARRLNKEQITPTLDRERNLMLLSEEVEYFYQNVAGPYEDSKIKENGDVYFE